MEYFIGGFVGFVFGMLVMGLAWLADARDDLNAAKRRTNSR